jgi:hypothetical protein
MSGEITRGLRRKLRGFKLKPREEANKRINNFILYSDQLKDLDRGEREETLVDLFFVSIIDERYAVPVATCHQSKHITLEECYEAICKYDNVIMQENIRDNNLTRLNKIRLVDRQGHKPEGNPDTSYRSYKE